MADEAYENEMQDLRRHVGRFVLEVLKAEGGTEAAAMEIARLVDQQLRSRRFEIVLQASHEALLNETIRSVTEASAQIAAAMASPMHGHVATTGFPEAVIPEAEFLEQDVAATDWTPQPVEAEVPQQQHPVAKTPEVKKRAAAAGPRWLKHWPVIATVVGVVFVMAVAGYLVMQMLAHRRAEIAAASTPAVNEATSATTEDQWRIVLRTVGDWPDERRSEAIRVLCGEVEEIAACPTAQARELDLAAQPETRAQAVSLITEALAVARCREAVSQSGSSDPQASGSPIPWQCLMQASAR